MLGPDVPVVQTLGLFGRICQNSLALVRKREVDRRRNLLTNGCPALDFLPDTFDRGMISQKTVRKVFVFANQTEQQVLGLDRRATELASFVAGEEDNPPCSLSVSFEHKFLILSSLVLRLI